MEERYIAAVDLGSTKIAITVARISGEDIQVLYYKERPSDGIINSAVKIVERLKTQVKLAIQEAEDALMIKVMQVVIGLPCNEVHQEVAQAKVQRSDPDASITAEEVESLKSLAQDNYPLSDTQSEAIYGAIAQWFSDDDSFQIIEEDIIGVPSRNFEGNFKIFIGKKRPLAMTDRVFNDLGIAIARKYFTPGTISKAVLSQEEMQNGVALIDFGGGVTSVTIYKDSILRYYASIPFGGKVITNDIRTECSISESLAENIKKAFGACMPDRLLNLEEKIIQIEGDEMEGYKQIPVKYLSEIITARAREIVDAILYEIQRSGLADNLRNGIVITGGGANLANLSILIKEMSGYNVRLGLPRHLFSTAGCSDAYSTSAANAIGMVIAAKADGMLNCVEEPQIETDDEEEEIIENGPVIPEDAPEGTETPIFTEEEVPVEKVEKKTKKTKTPKKPKGPGFLDVIWKKYTGNMSTITGNVSTILGNLYDSAQQEIKNDNT